MSGLRVLCLYFSKPQDLQGFAEIFYRATPQIVFRKDEALFLEISKCRNLYSETTFLARTQVTLRKIQAEAALAIADDMGTALSLAFFKLPYGAKKERLPIEALPFYVDPLGKNFLVRQKAFEMAKTLRLMGVKNIGDFLTLPIRELASRFSQVGLLAYLRVQGQTDEVWEPFSLKESVNETFEFDLESPAETLEPVYFRLMPMLERQALRLRARGLRARQIDIVLKQEHALPGEEQERRISLVIQLPFVTRKVIFQIAREKIETHVRAKPLRARLCEMRLETTETVPYTETQKNILDQKKEETEESFFQLVSRLATRLGRSSVFFAQPRASYLPEKNWQPVKEAPLEKDLQVPREQMPERPLRLLPKPIPLRLIQSPRFVVSGPDFSEEVLTVANKEVLFADWWESPLERIYFHLITKNTRRHLWVFRSQEGHFLHGVFE